MIELTARQAATVLDVTPDSVRRWARKGLGCRKKSMARRAGRARSVLMVFDSDELHDWCAQCGACRLTRARLARMNRECCVVVMDDGQYHWQAGLEIGVSETEETATDEVVIRLCDRGRMPGLSRSLAWPDIARVGHAGIAGANPARRIDRKRQWKTCDLRLLGQLARWCAATDTPKN